jgi:hypothetical protein
MSKAQRGRYPAEIRGQVEANAALTEERSSGATPGSSAASLQRR